jgi:hypothetical protein
LEKWKELINIHHPPKDENYCPQHGNPQKPAVEN